MNKLSIVVAITIALAIAPAHAQFKLPQLGKKADAAKTDDAVAAPSGDVLVASFQQSQSLVATAQATLSRAMGLDDQATLAQAEVKRLSSGPLDQEGLKKNREVSEALQSELLKTMKTQPALTAESRTMFATGLVEYLKAVGGARNLLVQAKGYTESIGANPMALMGKAKAALWVGKETPGYVKNLGTTSKTLLDYARRNNIETPANATAELDGL